MAVLSLGACRSLFVHCDCGGTNTGISKHALINFTANRKPLLKFLHGTEKNEMTYGFDD